MTFVSFAQNYEDVILNRVLKNVRHGFYVDVGAQHPVTESVTKAFSLKGWRGINVEPVSTWFEMLQQDRPYDINENVAIGSEDGELRLFEVVGTGLSTTDETFAARARAEGRTVTERRVPTRRLDDILARNNVKEVHFLKIDCEGAEKAALQSISLDTVRPWIILLEAVEPNSQIPNHQPWEYLLTDRGYVLAYDDGLNRFYVASEKSDLLPAFAFPPNIFDDFVRVGDKAAHDQLDAAHVRLRAITLELEGARSATAGAAESLRKVAAHYEHWRAEHQRQAIAAQTERDEAIARAAGADAEIAALRAEIDSLYGDRQRRHAAGRSGSTSEVDQLLRRQHEFLVMTEGLREQLKRQDEAILALTTSTSWRITKPLRSGVLFSRRVARRTWSISRPLVVKLARAGRPLVRGILKIGPLRRVAASLAGPETRLGRRIRRFLFPHGVAPVVGAQTPSAMSSEAVAIQGMLKDAIGRRK
ncbi:FkbM family methyltransferase [Luteibacter sp. Sphag1AF]|uniref:FkbM family methyltransferase n=1 Tax=Luteibacter sp. Sphag1AF TaxID=2587031 RepID=UPI0016189D6D|nr:FkbM family methyltransferase [Luteibacter sp. Sphag1AF]MBB3225874.1 FkbM family methyltransferase [Luteibacter sp. Sphag1AF]